MPDKFAVIGANSFSGKAFVAHMRGLGHEVKEFSRPQYDLAAPAKIAARIAHGGASYVVNFAALNMVAESWERASEYYRTNVVGVAAVCDWLRIWKWSGRFIQVSTPEVYGAQGGLIKEGAPFSPSTPYAVSRAAIDMHLRALHATYGFRVLFTRSVNVYGPGQQIYRLIPKTVLSILRCEKLKLHGGGVSRRAWLHVDDAAEAIRLIAVSGEEGEDYHIAAGSLVSIRDLVTMICAHINRPFEDAVETEAERPGKDMAYRLDDAKIRHLGWAHKIAFVQGLVDTVDWFRDHASEFAGQSLEYQHRG